MPTPSAHVQIAVIGGGLVGSAIAYGLAKQGTDVTVFDEGDLAFRASRGNFGLIWVQSKGMGMPQYAAWTRRSAALWPQLAAELIQRTGLDPDLQQPGGLHILLSDDEVARRKAFLGKLHAQPEFPRYPYQMLDRQDVKSIYPGIGPEVVGASYTSQDGHANPRRCSSWAQPIDRTMRSSASSRLPRALPFTRTHSATPASVW